MKFVKKICCLCVCTLMMVLMTGGLAFAADASLLDLEVVTNEKFYFASSKSYISDIKGNEYVGGYVQCDGCDGRWNGFATITYKLNKKYTTLRGNIIIPENSHLKYSEIRFYNENRKLLKKITGIDKDTSGKSFVVDVSNCEKLTIEVYNQTSSYNYLAFVNTKLSSYLITPVKSQMTLYKNTSEYNTVKVKNLKSGTYVKNPKVVYSSTDVSVAKVSSTGKVVAVSTGSCKIKVTYGNAVQYISVIVRPVKQTGVKKETATKNSITISWTKQKRVSGYEVWMYDPDLEEYSKIRTTDYAEKSTVAKYLSSGTTYKFKVRAYIKVNGKKVYGAFSNEISISTNR